MLLIALALLSAAAVAFVAWLLHRPAGSAWLLAGLPGVQVEAPEGTLLGDFSARRLQLSWPGGSAELRGLRWRGLGIAIGERQLLARELVADELSVHSEPGDTPLAAPADLGLPLAVHITSLRIAKLSWAPDQAPLLGLEAEVNLPRDGIHHLQLKAARWQHLNLAGEARIASAAPLQTDATLRLLQAEATELPWLAVATVTGPLARLKAKAELQAAHQALQADGEVQPFARWPVNALQLRADQLDLAPFAPGLPRTALTGTARLRAPAYDAEATLQAELRNGAAGRWDQRALPVARLAIVLAGRPDQPTRLRLTTLDAELAGGARVQGQGRLDADGRWQLDARVQGLRPEALDARATPARLDGPLTLSGSKAGPLSARLDLGGTLQDRPLRLQARAQGEGKAWQIENIQLASGDATLQARGRLDTGGALQLHAELRQLDPHLLWRGAPASAWARLPGPTRLNADADLDLRGTTAASLSGRVDTRLLPGQLAGLALEGHATLKRDSAAAPAAFDIDARLGSNRLQSGGQAAPEALTGTAALKAGALAELNPVIALFGQPPVAGQADADGSFQLLRTARGWQAGGSGRLALASAQALGASIASAKARWELPLPGADGDGPVALSLDIGQLRSPHAQLAGVKLDLQGRRSAHELKAQVNGRLPRDAGDLDLNAQLQARGRWDG